MMDTDRLGQHFLACLTDDHYSHGPAHAGTFQLLPTLRDSAPSGGKEEKETNHAYRFSLLLLYVDGC